MLLNMHIKNIVLIDDIDISFRDRLNILTGETGAGKSIIIGSLGICLGGSFKKELLRDETKDGLVELTFSVDRPHILRQLEAMDIPVDDGELLIARRLTAAGRTVNRINDNTVTTARLKEVAALLIDLHAQHEQQTLLKPAKHMEILDRFGGEDIEAAVEEVKKYYDSYVCLKKEIDTYTMDESARNKQTDFLAYEINEIEAAGLSPGEDEELELLYKKMSNAKEITGILDAVYRTTGYGSSSVSDSISRALGEIKVAAAIDSDLDTISNMLIDIDSMVSDLNRELADYMQSLEFDSEEYTDTERRLDLINSLKAKHGRTISDILEALEGYKKEYEQLASYDERLGKLNEKLAETEEALIASCDKLTNIRKKAAVRLCAMIEEALKELNFNSVKFEMSFNKLDKYSANGNDEAYFMLSTNVGEPVRPLYEVASGGELSRVMLALKSCIAYEDDTPTLIFDEIDVGISGKTANSVAKKLSIIARKHQVICITHLPQIASMADTHYIIEKNVENNKTTTNIRQLDEKRSLCEIARLLGGEVITDTTISNAREMKEMADKTKIY